MQRINIAYNPMGLLNLIWFRIDGDPIAWKAHGGYGRRSFNPLFKERSYVQWEVTRQLKESYPDFEIIDGPVEINYQFRLPLIRMSRRNKEYALAGKIYPRKKIDCTNMMKFYEDCLKGIIITDDSLVMKCSCKKEYSNEPCVIINITRLPEYA